MVNDVHLWSWRPLESNLTIRRRSSSHMGGSTRLSSQSGERPALVSGSGLITLKSLPAQCGEGLARSAVPVVKGEIVAGFRRVTDRRVDVTSAFVDARSTDLLQLRTAD